MKRFVQFFLSAAAVLVLALSLTHDMRVRTPRGMFLRSVKSLAEGLAHYLMAISAASALLGSLLKAPAAALAGFAGALLSWRYLRGIRAARAGFKRAFGPDWQAKINCPGLLERRWYWRLPAPAQEPRWEQDVVYHTIEEEEPGEGEALLCDLWHPPVSVPRSGLALIYVHGGGYFTSQKDFGTRAFFRHLAAQGHLVMDINYRLAPKAGLMDMLSDVLHAVAWMKTNAEWLEADPDRIVLAGGSAGAHLALLAAYANHHPRLTPLALQETDLQVRGVVSYYGIIDLADTYRSIQRFFGSKPSTGAPPKNLLDLPLAGRMIEMAAWVRGVEPFAMREYLRENQDLLFTGLDASMDRLLDGSPDEIPEVYRMVSPLAYVSSNCPPTLLLQGEHDYLLPLEPARALYEQLLEAGVPALYLELPRTEHTFDLFLPAYSPPAQAALYHVERFLALLCVA